jgi:diguanylate cyclase (GGDEF)-like protein/PAS domain S-box-containing protein
MNIGPRASYRAALAAAVLTLLGGLGACASWIAGVPEATRLMAASSLAQFNTGLLFVLGGAGLIAGLRARPWACAASAAAIVLLATATLAQYLAGVNLGIDEFVVAGSAGAETPGRMAPNTAVTFVLSGFALLFLAASARLPWAAGIVQMLSALVLAVGAIALVGYTADIAAAFQWAGLTRMALYTAIGFAVLGAGLTLAAMHASRAGAWHELPWLAASAGVGLAALAGLGWYALRNAPAAAQQRLADIVVTFGLLTAALVTGAVAQARHLRRQAAQLAAMNAALQASEGQLQLLLDSVQTAVIVHGPDSAIRYANPAAAAILGLTRDQLLGKTSMDPQWHFVREDGAPMPIAEYPVSLVFARKAALHDYMVGVRAAPGRNARWVLVNAVPDLAPDGGVRLVIVSFVDISVRQHQTRQLEHIALTDSLTGLASRRHFLAEAEREVRRARRGHALSALVLDVDHFKSINDAHGHAAGDRVLVELGRTVRGVLRDADLAGRLGGEEFGALLPDADEDLARAVAERLRVALAAAAVPLDGARELRFTVSIGAATLGPGDADSAALLARADAAMYEAKRAGRNRVRAAPRAAA